MALNIWDKFLAFESENRLFDLKDSKGNFVWDMVRFDIYINLLWSYSSNKKKTDILSAFYRLWTFSKVLFLKKKYFFYITSRNQYNGCLIDQNAYSAIKSFPAQDVVLLESFADLRTSKLGYGGIDMFGGLPLFIFSKLGYFPQYDFETIIKCVNKEFPQNRVTSSDLSNLYKIFYIHKCVYKFLFRKLGIKKVFLTQNGIQKGLISACRDLSISIVEFQHGIVDRGHIAYSYPIMEELENKVYLPDKIMALSDFWFNDCFLPRVQISAVGNDFFAEKRVLVSGKSKTVLIISADVFGETLSDFLLRYLSDPFLMGYSFYFKLHPNQFDDYEIYCDRFASYKNVIVIKNEMSVPQLIEKTSVLFTIQSTAVYEALQLGGKVILLKESSYRRQEHIFTFPNVYLVGDRDELVQALKSEKINSHPLFFKEFDKMLFEENCMNE